jgi:hypothetical protein
MLPVMKWGLKPVCGNETILIILSKKGMYYVGNGTGDAGI